VPTCLRPRRCRSQLSGVARSNACAGVAGGIHPVLFLRFMCRACLRTNLRQLSATAIARPPTGGRLLTAGVPVWRGAQDTPKLRPRASTRATRADS